MFTLLAAFINCLLVLFLVYRNCLHPVLIFSMQMKFSDGQSEFSRLFNFVILGYLRNSRKLDAREKIVFYSISFSFCSHQQSVHFLFVDILPSLINICHYLFHQFFIFLWIKLDFFNFVVVLDFFVTFCASHCASYMCDGNSWKVLHCSFCF